MRLGRSAVCVPFTLLLLSACSGDDESSQPADTGAADGSGDPAADTSGTDGSGSGAPDGSAAEEVRCGDGTCSPSESETDCPDDCGDAPTLRYALDGTDIYAFPDDSLTVPDTTTVTGLRIALTPELPEEVPGPGRPRRGRPATTWPRNPSRCRRRPW